MEMVKCRLSDISLTTVNATYSDTSTNTIKCLFLNAYASSGVGVEISINGGSTYSDVSSTNIESHRPPVAFSIAPLYSLLEPSESPKYITVTGDNFKVSQELLRK